MADVGARDWEERRHFSQGELHGADDQANEEISQERAEGPTCLERPAETEEEACALGQRQRIGL